ncbi:hypothetical protein ACIP5Y_11275 [Nocardia sp. NPDC088792]|uniref:hypothetical protein n=1 Tax=Nocardia sp. NPDC088792 TaxID=3364332 RepID=UPI0037F408A6
MPAGSADRHRGDFFDPGHADPNVVALDEATKETFSLTEYPDGLLATLPGESSLIDVPVMVVDGDHDRLTCGAGFSACADAGTLYAAEAPYFAPAARLRTFIVPNSGHSINLARDTKAYQAQVIDWMRSIAN